MIEKYIEKDLFRQIILCERFHKNSYISVTAMAELFDVFPKTIESDIQKLATTLAEYVVFKEKNRKNYYLVFRKDTSQYELETQLYRQSLFLNVCQMMTDGKEEYLDIVEEYFVSVSKSYMLIKEVKNFFSEAHLSYVDKKLTCPELSWRLLKLCLNLKLNKYPDISFPDGFEKACDTYIDMVAAKYPQIHYSKMKRTLLKHGLFLSYARKDIQHAHDAGFQDIIKPLPFYQNLKKIWTENGLRIFLGDEEFFYVFYLFHSLNYSYKEIVVILENEQVLDEMIQHQYSEFAELAHRLAMHLGNEGLNDRAFKQAFMRLIRTSYADHQLLLPHPIYVVEPEIRKFSDDIFQVIEKWGAEQEPKQSMDQSLIHRFVDEYARVHYHSKTVIKVRIVTDSPIKFIVYRDFLTSSWLQLEVDTKQYESLKEVSHKRTSSTLILCESSLFNDDIRLQMRTLVPIMPIDLASIHKPGFGRMFYGEIENSLWG